MATPASNDETTAEVPYTADISAWFADEDAGDTLTYSLVAAADEANADVSGEVTLNPSTGALEYVPSGAQASKTVTIVVKASDGTADSGTVTITVNVGAIPPDANRPPTVVAPGFADITGRKGGTDVQVSAAGIFADADNDGLTYTAVSSDEPVAAVTVTGDTIAVTPLESGVATITVTADDNRGGTVSDSFTITVAPE